MKKMSPLSLLSLSVPICPSANLFFRETGPRGLLQIQKNRIPTPCADYPTWAIGIALGPAMVKARGRGGGLDWTMSP
jgi:hypothetical protein